MTPRRVNQVSVHGGTRATISLTSLVIRASPSRASVTRRDVRRSILHCSLGHMLAALRQPLPTGFVLVQERSVLRAGQVATRGFRFLGQHDFALAPLTPGNDTPSHVRLLVPSVIVYSSLGRATVCGSAVVGSSEASGERSAGVAEEARTRSFATPAFAGCALLEGWYDLAKE